MFKQQDARTGGDVRRTTMDVYRFVIYRLLGPVFGEAFERNIMPQFQFNPEAYQEITETQFQLMIEQAEKELPYFARMLLDQRFQTGDHSV